ncbi:MAG: tetratricopeptide repeat protein, partial [Armatimonadetes bacterium]|nr:tetratricopeptide repeat protein [Anaerolineae bacterium]
AAVFEKLDDAWRFAHDRLREAVLNDLAPVERAALHRQVAQGIEAAYPASSAHAELLTDHWYAAGDIAKSVQYTLLAAPYLLNSVNNYRRAQQLLERVLDHTADVIPSQRAHLHCLLGETFGNFAMYDDAIAHYALCLQDAGDDDKLQVEALCHTSRALERQGKLDAAAQHTQRALAIVTARPDPANGVLVQISQANLAYTQGDLARAQAYNAQSLAYYRAQGNQFDTVRILNNLGMIAHDQRDYPLALTYYAESLTLCDTISAIFLQSMTQGNIGLVQYSQGQYANACANLEQALKLQRQIGNRWAIAAGLTNLVFTYTALGNLDAARRHLGEGLALAYAIGVPAMVVELVVGAAWLRLKQGDAVYGAQLLGMAEAHPAMSDEIKALWYDGLLADFSVALDTTTFATAQAAGAAFDFDATVAAL